jgi:hypothetical protein
MDEQAFFDALHPYLRAALWDMECPQSLLQQTKHPKPRGGKMEHAAAAELPRQAGFSDLGRVPVLEIPWLKPHKSVSSEKKPHSQTPTSQRRKKLGMPWMPSGSLTGPGDQ